MKKNPYNKLLFVAFILILFSCQHNERKKFEAILEFYLNGLIAFESNLIKHFPFEFEQGEIQEMIFKLPGNVKKGEYAFALVRIKPSERKYQMIADSINNEYSPINIEKNEGLIMLPDSSDFSSIVNPVIIPKFYEILGDSISHSDFISKYNIFIIDSDTGVFSGANDLIQGITNLPSNFKHGYSRGYGINERDRNIIYWLIIW
jgi:hypothetical protein